jgi:hypothetical protein
MRYDRRNAGASAEPFNGVEKCNVTKITTEILNQAAATAFTITMQLQRCNCFWPCSMRIWGRATAAATTVRAFNVQQIETNACAQECGSVAALAVGALNYIGIGRDYMQETCWYGIPVCHSPFCRQAFAETNTVGLENNDVGAGDYAVSYWGNACPAVPPGLTCGKPPGAQAFS